ncbi:MAG: DEAD/DEAH box helicase [Myxococcales bacterium]|nr:DEAD/DEAH box helicase [Myxococcales bacterium]
MSTEGDIELEFYDKFFFSRDLEPYPVQEEAVGRIFAGDHVLITVPTGTGKTLMGKAALMRALRSGKCGIYTTPLRALTEEKFREFQEDFGEDNVGFATGDYKVNPEAPIQVVVAEILWNRIYGGRGERVPADVVVMDEGHYFNDLERGYVWEQSIIGLGPKCQLVILSATVGEPQSFCQWARVVRGVPLELVTSSERKVPLYHEWREDYLVETVKRLYASGDFPALIFSFGRALSYERARLLKSCPRFVNKEEQAEIVSRSDSILLPKGFGSELRSLLEHGIGIHHAGILPSYRRLVEELTADRLLKFVVTTETIAAGINLPAKRVIFPSLRKYIKGKARLLLPSEYHQMAGRAGRPQFDTEGIAIALGPEDIVQDFRKEVRDLKKRGALNIDESKVKRKYYTRAKSEAKVKKDVIWDEESHRQLVEGQPEQLRSKTQITAEQILAIGLPNLAERTLRGQKAVEEERKQRAAQDLERTRKEIGRLEGMAFGEAPSDEEAETLAQLKVSLVEAEKVLKVAQERVEAVAYQILESQVAAEESGSLDIERVIDRLLLPDHAKWDAHKRLAQITANLQALGILNSEGRQVTGFVIRKLQGVDGVFTWWVVEQTTLEEGQHRELVELLVEHDAIQRIFEKRERAKIREWCIQKLRELRRDNPQASFEDAETLYWEKHPRELTRSEQALQTFLGKVTHPELHGGKVQKKIWSEMQDEDLTFVEYVSKHDLGREEGSFFTYLARVMKAARMLHEVTERPEFADMEKAIRNKLAAIDERVLEGLW